MKSGGGGNSYKISSNNSIIVSHPLHRAQSGTDKQISTNPKQKLNNDLDTISGERQPFEGFISDRKQLK